MHVYSLLDCLALVNNVLVFDADHAIVVCLLTLLHFLLLITEPWLTRAEWIHLVPLTDLEGERSHLILKKLVGQVASRAWELLSVFGHGT